MNQRKLWKLYEMSVSIKFSKEVFKFVDHAFKCYKNSLGSTINKNSVSINWSQCEEPQLNLI